MMRLLVEGWAGIGYEIRSISSNIWPIDRKVLGSILVLSTQSMSSKSCTKCWELRIGWYFYTFTQVELQYTTF